MNWYDGIAFDRLWVGHSKFWVLPGTEDIPYVQTWRQVLRKRGVLTLVWLVGAAIVAGLVILIFEGQNNELAADDSGWSYYLYRVQWRNCFCLAVGAGWFFGHAAKGYQYPADKVD